MRKSRRELSGQRHELVLPDLGALEAPAMSSLWLVELGEEVTQGDRLLEVVAGAATIDLPSPASGTLAEIWVEEDEPLKTGQVLGVVVGQRDADA